MEILRLLDSLPIVAGYEILDFKIFESGQYYKMRISFDDGSTLHAREFVDEVDRKGDVLPTREVTLEKVLAHIVEHMDARSR